jgi:hypothetical protein
VEKLSNILGGVAGEYFVAAELSRRGYIASITLRNTRGIDILCSNECGTKQVSIQVKTTKDSNRVWILDKKAEDFYSSNHFYVFVMLNTQDVKPDFFIIPSKVVAKFVKENHQNWLNGKSKTGKTRKDSSMRKFQDVEGKYLNRWDLLDLN